jgi:fucose permease
MSVPTNSYNNNSQNGSDVRLISSTPSMTDSRKKFSPFVKWATLILLFIVNLLNYMDRFTIVGVLSAVQQEFDIGQTKAALLQTVFLVSYMALSPIVGYLGKPHMQ